MLNSYFIIIFIALLYSVCSTILFGIRTNNHVAMTSTTSLPSQGNRFILKSHFAHIKKISACTIIGFYGDSAHCEMFYDLLLQQVKIYKLNFQNKEMTPTNLANLARYIILSNLCMRLWISKSLP